MLVDHTIFSGELNIAQLETTPVSDKVDLFIKNREPEVLRDVFGDDGYKLLLELNTVGLPSISVKTSTSEDGKGKFYVDNAAQLDLITQEPNGISFVSESPYDLVISCKPGYPDLPLSDYLRTASLTSTDGVSQMFECYDINGSLGKVIIDSDRHCFIEDPSLWGLNPLDFQFTYDEMIEISDDASAMCNGYGFVVNVSYEKNSIYKSTFLTDTYYFYDHDIVSQILKDAKFIAASFIWYWYSRDLNSFMSAMGTARGKAENAEPVDPAGSQAKIWNEMSDCIYKYVTPNNRSHIRYMYNIWRSLLPNQEFQNNWRNIVSKYKKINVLNF